MSLQNIQNDLNIFKDRYYPVLIDILEQELEGEELLDELKK